MRQVISELEERLDAPTAKGLAHAVSRAIRDGVLAPGDRLPPIRQVATELMVSPTTVNAAWQLLARSGTLRSAGRRGTTVTALSRAAGARYARALHHESEVELDLSTGVPDPALLPPLTDALTTVRTTAPTSYLDDPVLPSLRRIIEEDWPYPPEDILVVDGAMDALDLVVRALFRPTDAVVVEDPCFPPLLDLLEVQGIEVIGVPLDDTGLQLGPLESALDRRPAAVFLQPRAQNPTGVSTSPTRARRLASALRGRDVIVVEDDSAGHVATTESTSLGTWLPERVLHIRSYSKSHGPDLRLAVLAGPSALLSQVQRTRALGQGWTSHLLQSVLVELLTAHTAQEHVSRARRAYALRRARVVEHLARRGVEVPGTDGLNIWVPVHDEAAATLRLASAGIAVTPGSPFVVHSGDRAGRDGRNRGPEGGTDRERCGHIRVTTGLVDTDHERIADLIADAATTGAWTAQHR